MMNDLCIKDQILYTIILFSDNIMLIKCFKCYANNKFGNNSYSVSENHCHIWAEQNKIFDDLILDVDKKDLLKQIYCIIIFLIMPGLSVLIICTWI